MTRKELNLAIFEGTAQKVLWQPRLETWIDDRMKKGTMPDRFKGMNSIEIYDALGCSMRYHASCGIDRLPEPEDVVREREQQGDFCIHTVTTPSGTIRMVHREVRVNGKIVNSRISEYGVKTPQDVRVMTDLIEREEYRVNLPVFEAAAAAVGHRTEPTIILCSSGFTELIKRSAGLENTFYILHDCPQVIEEHLEACEARDRRILREALKLPCRIFNLGDHSTNEFTPPPILKKYLLPRWQWISDMLNAEGRFVHSHWDGHSLQILPYLKETHLNGVEALTPRPMGDMTLEQIKAAVGDKMVCLDLLPAIHFMAHYTTQEVVDFARRVIDMFAPRLILGVSDEISQVGQIEKIEAISELVDEVCGLAE